MKRFKIILIIASLVLAASLVVLGIFWFPKAAAKNVLEVDFLDVGQGDAILIRTPAKQDILIDGGPDSSVIEALGRHLPFYDRDIEIMILTHPHSDHVAGLVEVLRRFKVREVWYTGAAHDSPDYSVWLREIESEGANLKIIEKPEIINLENNLAFNIFYPRENFAGKRAEELNNTSIVAKLSYGEADFLFTGDAEAEVEQKILETGDNLSAEVLKVGHHGSLSSTSKEFLEAVSPKTAVIEVGADNNFGHPAYRTIRNLEKAGAEIWRTDEDGDVILKTDGKGITLQNR